MIVAMLLSLPTVSFNVERTFAADKRDFRVVNDTSTTLDALYVSTSNATNWGDNILGQKIPSGASAHLSYTGKDSECLFDLKGVFSDGIEVDEKQVNLCKVGTYTFNDDKPLQ